MAGVVDVVATVLLAIENEWSYVGWSYALVVGALVAYAVWTVVRGRRAGRQLPPEERRWM